MKTILLRKFTDVKPAGQDTPGVDITSIQLIKNCVNQPTQGGLDIDEMKKRIRVLNVLDKLSGEEKEFTVEDADHQTIVNCAKSMRYAFPNQAFIDFDNDILNPASSN